MRRYPINDWTDAVGHGAVIAIDPKTGQPKWKFQMYDVTDGGILTTAGDVLFTGNREGYFHALDARTGAVLWKAALGGAIMSAPVTYAIDGKQYVIVNSGNVMATFELRE
jgi:alcohol dehydrogenase (cytochrome c)